MTKNELIVYIEKLLESKSDASYAEKMAAYMKDNFVFFGVRGPDRNQILKEVKLNAKQFDIDDLFDITIQCWQLDQREYQYLCIDLLKWKHKHLRPEHLEILENLITTKSWWDSVDGIAPNLVGFLLSKDKNLQYQWTERWIENDNLWLRRSAIIHQLRYKDMVDEELLFALVESQIGKKEFFINKACGWALRQYGKFNPSAVKGFIDLHSNLAGLTVREASKYL